MRFLSGTRFVYILLRGSLKVPFIFMSTIVLAASNSIYVKCYTIQRRSNLLHSFVFLTSTTQLFEVTLLLQC